MFPNSPVLTYIHLQNHEFGQCQKGFYAELINPVALQDPINQNKRKMTFKESKNENTVIVTSKDLQPTKKCICQQLVRRETGVHITRLHSRPQSVVQSLDRTFQRITHSPTDSEHFLGQLIQK